MFEETLQVARISFLNLGVHKLAKGVSVSILRVTIVLFKKWVPISAYNELIY